MVAPVMDAAKDEAGAIAPKPTNTDALIKNCLTKYAIFYLVDAFEKRVFRGISILL
ncbi:hypothetical protein OSCI_3100012 [Kamptonema sp. PCC 6506]|nr:hypothetical protein OSCI_3100012 [Kamptonema sp. PCC 6506]